MARHAAADGAAAHPLVAAALAARSADDSGAHRPGSDGPIGWPGTPPPEGGGGLGWPGDLPDGDGVEQESGEPESGEPESGEPGSGEDADGDPVVGRQEAENLAPGRWRRLFARRTAA